MDSYPSFRRKPESILAAGTLDSGLHRNDGQFPQE